MKTLYSIEVSNRDTGEIYEMKCYWQRARISKYCNKMYRKYGERVYCIVRADGKIIEEWGA